MQQRFGDGNRAGPLDIFFQFCVWENLNRSFHKRSALTILRCCKKKTIFQKFLDPPLMPSPPSKFSFHASLINKNVQSKENNSEEIGSWRETRVTVDPVKDFSLQKQDPLEGCNFLKN